MKKLSNMPALVYWGLWGIHSRATAFGFFWVSVALAVGLTITIYEFANTIAGVVFFLSAAWYWYAIKWADKNSAWGDK